MAGQLISTAGLIQGPEGELLPSRQRTSLTSSVERSPWLVCGRLAERETAIFFFSWWAEPGSILTGLKGFEPEAVPEDDEPREVGILTTSWRLGIEPPG